MNFRLTRHSLFALCATVAGIAALGASTCAAADTAAPPLAVTSGNAKSVDQIPFVNGSTSVPFRPNSVNSRGVITDTTLPGMTHVEGDMWWRLVEPQKDQWNLGDFDTIIALAHKKGLKISLLPILMWAPDWFKQSADYTPMVNMQTGQSVDFLSPWAPGTAVAFDHFYGALAARYKNGEIDILKYAHPASDFGEIGLTIGARNNLPGGSEYAVAPEDPAAWKQGYWCGDKYARADFRQYVLAKYSDVAHINSAWGTNFAGDADIDYPDPDRRAGQDRRWIDFLSWIQDSQVRLMARYLGIIRKNFPSTLMSVPEGFGDDQARFGCDRTAIVRAAAQFAPVSIRSTHSGTNRNKYPHAYWFYKRMAPMCHDLGIGFGCEPPGGDFTYAEISREYFEAASAGVNFVYQYYQNFRQKPDGAAAPTAISDYKRILRPFERSLVDIGILYPNTQMMLDMNGFPTGQIELCAVGRENFDYDIVDENMISWGILNNYKVLLYTSGKVFREGTIPELGKWIAKGGVLVTNGLPQWSDVTGKTGLTNVWLLKEDKDAENALTATGAHVFREGKGYVCIIDTPAQTNYLSSIVKLLTNYAALEPRSAPLHGFKAQADGTYMTEFPDGKLVFDEKTLQTTFVALAR